MTISRECQAGIKPNPAGSLGGRSLDRHQLGALSLAAQLTPPSLLPQEVGAATPPAGVPALWLYFFSFG